MIRLSKLRELNVWTSEKKLDQTFLSAASGLTRYGDWFYVVADDENSLGIFSLQNSEPGTLFQLLPGELPTDPKARKAIKPDFEAITLIPEGVYSRDPQLLIVPSGSTPNRMQGLLVTILEKGAKLELESIIDFNNLYLKLSAFYDELNIEGATVSGQNLKLFQRGNGKTNQNATIDLELSKVIEGLRVEKSINASSILNTKVYDLGKLNGAPLSFTDATTIGDRIVFIAAAEATSSTYEDGLCLGSVAGTIDPQSGEITSLNTLSHDLKLEGVTASVTANETQLLLVSDADDRSRPAELLFAVLSEPHT